MTHIEQMIQDMCPHGVEFKTLGEVCEMKRGSTITANQAQEGVIPVIAGGQKPAYYHNQSNREGLNITVAGSGAYAGYVAFWEQPIFVSDAFTVSPKDTSLDIKFVYYFLKNIQPQIHNTKKGSGVPHVHPSSISDFEIPLPPLEIQKKSSSASTNSRHSQRSCKRSCNCVVSSMSTTVPNYSRPTRIAILLETQPMIAIGNGKHWERYLNFEEDILHRRTILIFGREVLFHGLEWKIFV